MLFSNRHLKGFISSFYPKDVKAIYVVEDAGHPGGILIDDEINLHQHHLFVVLQIAMTFTGILLACRNWVLFGWESTRIVLFNIHYSLIVGLWIVALMAYKQGKLNKETACLWRMRSTYWLLFLMMLNTGGNRSPSSGFSAALLFIAGLEGGSALAKEACLLSVVNMIVLHLLQREKLLPPSIVRSEDLDPQILSNMIAMLVFAYGCLVAFNRINGHNVEKVRTLADEALKANTTKTVFLATMSHELRTPLAQVMMVNDLLEAELGPVLGPAHKNEIQLQGPLLPGFRTPNSKASGPIETKPIDLRDQSGTSYPATPQDSLTGRKHRRSLAKNGEGRRTGAGRVQPHLSKSSPALLSGGNTHIDDGARDVADGVLGSEKADQCGQLLNSVQRGAGEADTTDQIAATNCEGSLLAHECNGERGPDTVERVGSSSMSNEEVAQNANDAHAHTHELETESRATAGNTSEATGGTRNQPGGCSVTASSSSLLSSSTDSRSFEGYLCSGEAENSNIMPVINVQEVRNLFRVMEGSCRLLLSVVNDILDLNKIEAGKCELEIQPVDLPLLVKDCVSLFRHAAKSKRINLRFQSSPDVPALLMLDPVRCQQILINLIGNAMKFTHDGSITVSLFATPESVGIAVKDTGIGISEAGQARLFQPFCQAEAGRTTRKYGGTGLGLLISKQLAIKLGGNLTVKSQEGVGSTFTVVFARKVPDPSQVHHAGRVASMSVVSSAEPIWGHLSVLLIDDNEVIAKLARKLLEAMSIHVTVAHDGEAGLRHFSEHKGEFDLVLLDICMPGMDGYEVARRMRAIEEQEGRPRLPIIALSAATLTEDKQRAIDAGFDDYMTKPFTKVGMVARLRQFEALRPPSASPKGSHSMASA